MSLKPNYKLNSLNYIRQITSHKFRTVFSRLECNEVKLFIFRNSELLEERPICLHQPSLFKTVHVHWWLWGFSSFSLLWYYNSNNLGEKSTDCIYFWISFLITLSTYLHSQRKKEFRTLLFSPLKLLLLKTLSPNYLDVLYIIWICWIIIQTYTLVQQNKLWRIGKHGWGNSLN